MLVSGSVLVNVKERWGKISLTRKKHREDVTEGLPLSSTCRLLIVAGRNVLLAALVLIDTQIGLLLCSPEYHAHNTNSVLLMDFRIAGTRRRQSIEGPDLPYRAYAQYPRLSVSRLNP